MTFIDFGFIANGPTAECARGLFTVTVKITALSTVHLFSSHSWFFFFFSGSTHLTISFTLIPFFFMSKLPCLPPEEIILPLWPQFLFSPSLAVCFLLPVSQSMISTCFSQRWTYCSEYRCFYLIFLEGWTHFSSCYIGLSLHSSQDLFMQYHANYLLCLLTRSLQFLFLQRCHDRLHWWEKVR